MSERERVRLAGCGVAALGYVKDDEMKPGDYGHSASLDDVLRLRAREAHYRVTLEMIRSFEQFRGDASGDAYSHIWDLANEALASTQPAGKDKDFVDQDVRGGAV
jgi:hypothetical protein